MATAVIKHELLPIGASTWTEMAVGDGGGNYVKAVTLTMCNQNPTPASIRVALTNTPNIVTNSDYLEYDLQIFGNETFERTGIMVPDGYYLYVSSSVANVSSTIWGIEEYVAGAVIAEINITNGGTGYVDNNPPNVVVGVPGQMDAGEQTLCTRDLGYMIDAAKTDMAIGTNYNAVTAGIRFNFGLYTTSSDKVRVQNAITHSETTIKAMTNVTGAVETAIVAAYAEVIDIMDNGISSANAMTFPDFNTGRADWTDRKNGGAQLQANKDFIAADVNQWVTNNHSTHFNTYSEIKCTRDSGFLVDALTYDLLYGGTTATTIMAKSFFDGGVSQLTTATERTVVAAAYNHLASIASDIIQEATVNAQTGNNLTQDKNGTPASAAEGTIVRDDLMQIVEDAITANSSAGIPAAVAVDVATSANITPHTDITTDQATIIASAVASVASGAAGGEQATAIATVVGGIVTAIQITNPGALYAPGTPPDVTIDAPGAGTTATADAVLGGQGLHLPTSHALTSGNANKLLAYGDGGGQYAKIITLNICNRNKMPVKFRAALTNVQGTVAKADYIEYDTMVFGRNAFERTGIIVPDGYYLYVSCDTDNVTATAYGIKEQV